VYRPLLAALFLLTSSPVMAQSESAFETIAPHVIVMDYETGTILYEKGAREPMAPASMTKIMTAEMVFEKIRDGSLTRDTLLNCAGRRDIRI